MPKEYEEASLAQGPPYRDRVPGESVRPPPAASPPSIVLGIGRAIGETMAVIMVAGNVANMPGLFQSVRFLTTAVSARWPTPPACNGRPCSPSPWFSFSSSCSSILFSIRFSSGRRGDILIWK